MSAASILKAIAKLTDKGYPEEVAERIAKGELLMDPASVAKRVDEQGYGPVLYRGHDTAYPPKSDQDMWMSSSLNDAETYARARGTQYTDGSIDGAGTVTPLRTNADYHGINNLAYVRGDNKMYDKVTTNDLKNPGIRQGIIRGTDDISEAVRDSGLYQGTHFRNIKDEFYAKSSTEPSDVYNILGSRPDVKIRHPDAAFDPQYSGPNIMGGAAGTAGLTGLLAAGQSEDSEAGFITKGGKTLLEAFHGSPHKFDKFSMDQIGTGEGAQAYGHGLYFADSEDVAKGYRDGLTANATVEMATDGDPAEWAAHLVRMHGGEDRAKLVLAGDDGSKLAIRPQRQNAFDAIENGSYKNYEIPEGALYRTEIDVTPESLLDWDKPLSEQSDHIKSEFAKYADERGMAQETRDQFRGEQIYERLGSSIDPERGRGLLLDKNIKGIKYLDGDSRAAGDGTSNYVIFDDSLINIAERGNATAPMMGLLASGTAGAGLLLKSLFAEAER